jgi:hypothetical protein
MAAQIAPLDEKLVVSGCYAASAKAAMNRRTPNRLAAYSRLYKSDLN